jgi:flagellar basal-body rod protein FlgG
MIRSLWIAKTGLDAQQTQLDVISNNLANVSTNGYKRSRAVFEDLLYQNMRQPGAQSSQTTQVPTGFMVGTGVRPVATARMFGQGNLQQTGNTLDMAISGQGFFQVLMPDGTTSYTRDGSFHVDSQGQMVTSNGFTLQPPVTIPAGAQSITIGQDGTVSVTQAGSTAITQAGATKFCTGMVSTELFAVTPVMELSTAPMSSSSSLCRAARAISCPTCPKPTIRMCCTGAPRACASR